MTTSPVDIANVITQTITALASKTGEVIKSYGPETVSFAAHYLHTVAIINAVIDLVYLLFAALIALLVYKMIKFIIKFESDINDARLIVCGFGSIICSIFFAIIFFSIIMHLLTTQELLGLFAPKIAVVQYVLNTVSPN
jgi:hypothetical protein